jgi:hypothetical protein
MADTIKTKQTWVAPKLTVFGDVNGLTQVSGTKAFAAPADGIFVVGFGHVLASV